ncbi:TPA: hypothetical protein DIU27_04700 [Candidatus Collierbacteria bacterium]|uniref:Excinuclease ABC C subunit domain protein n=1 Tax=Candidatus Collierbacteria bacterium GW2011_GWB2_44_22 TaxID=1618387 RepID=A0A0G1HYW1_9BACT|nr:MAG: Excinuclease ABC C subunit domain protein [Candidatus Collierbacteria bacterium GW2011_GWA2_44_13]KKT51763.1 MAG: Excinuclease ABC C subunit domain protein [Candidatus Collierbacteria bacterium GW2011_GWB2_44_22]KKT65482.1 MAG: Excinuclease ABC C subunit domain protein [Candidatus Collierbacteria bacterium GW2011_GWC2_44_30]KKT68299.1 MAG: Excinuclease ABC C subunit domain protein [Microgenomates group bacterium GW2011_GWC1_44_37]HCQ31648.1 hypothetical protein [Candidatus Collierbacter
MRKFFVYILASYKYGTLYVGVTGNLQNRMEIHQSGVVEGFTKKYKVNKLVYYEEFNSPEEAILREKQLKRWKRFWKINLIETVNPDWEELII